MRRKFIDTDRFSQKMRARATVLEDRGILITNFYGSTQEGDLTVPPNCDGHGRVRHFRRVTNPNWPPDPLPMEPACRALGLETRDRIRAQVFQIAACNWRCWYCFVDYRLLSADQRYAAFLTPKELIDSYLKESDRPLVIDLSGGHPDLVPEWVPWMMQELEARGLDRETYLWSDDNLSTDFFWKHLNREDIDLICGYSHYGRVCCFKGFDGISFSFNTRATPNLFDRQFELMERLLRLGLDLYCYTTFTTPIANEIDEPMARFVDRLQQLDPNLPLRTVPLEIGIYGPVEDRLHSVPSVALDNQYRAVEAWLRELETRYSGQELNRPITEVPLRHQRHPRAEKSEPVVRTMFSGHSSHSSWFHERINRCATGRVL